MFQADMAMQWESGIVTWRAAGTTIEKATVKDMKRGLYDDETLWMKLDRTRKDYA